LNWPQKISNRKARGVFVLLIIIIMVVLMPRLLQDLSSNEPLLVTFKEIDSGISEIEKKKYLSVPYYKKKSIKYKSPPTKFDPNKYQEHEWIALGLSPKQAKVVLSFAKRGIKNNDELKQIFVIDDRLFQLIKDSTIYPVYTLKQGVDNKNIYSQKKQPIELNKATEEQLVALPMIGDFLAKKIIERRQQLGGYHSLEQLLEIKFLDVSKLDVIRPFLTIDFNEVKLININTCTVEDLQKHPYISWNVANSIIKMRVYLKKYTNFDQLLESRLISIELLEKITPYLTLED